MPDPTTDPQPAFRNDAILWYNVPTWAPLGLAVPNFSNDSQSLNEDIIDLVNSMGRNLQGVMFHGDAMLRTPPTVNTLIRAHRLITRARDLLASRAVSESKPQMETQHIAPAPEVFRVYPVPYFKVRNKWMRSWCQYVLWAIAEAMQHTENRKALAITPAFTGLVGQYLSRVYKRMAVELLQIDATRADAPDFTLTDADFAAYSPSKWFTSTEMIDTVAPLDFPTEDDVFPLTEGIPVTELPKLSRWPASANLAVDAGKDAAAGGSAGAQSGTSAGTSTSSFAPPPAP